MQPACPCGRGGTYVACCGPQHAGSPALTAEQLMRSRYSAFALGRPDHLLATWAAATRPARVELDPQRRWVGLNVLATSAGGALDASGTVEFEATSELAGRREVLHELSAFAREAGRWVYVGPLG